MAGLGLLALGAALSPLVVREEGGLTDLALFLRNLRKTGGSSGGSSAVRSGCFSVPSTVTLGIQEMSSSLKSLMSLGVSRGVVSEERERERG